MEAEVYKIFENNKSFICAKVVEVCQSKFCNIRNIEKIDHL